MPESKITLILLFFFLSLPSVGTANSLNVVINEIAWVGTILSANNEWIELHNNTENNINLDGWQLIAKDGTPKINLSGIISANGFYLLERTDDNAIPEVSADKIYAGALGNNGELLKLYDLSGNLIDEISCATNWFAGDNNTKQTMERKSPQLPGDNPDNWQTSQSPGGTPKAKNSIVVQAELQPQTKSSEPVIDANSKQAQIVYPSGIIINEILPSPKGSDEKEEWIEIFNQNNFKIDLSGWQIVDVRGKATVYTLPEGISIEPLGFLVFSRPSTKITLNNDGDGLNLIQPTGNIIDSVNYEKAPQGQSYNRTEAGWAWNIILTPGNANIISSPLSSQFKPEEKEKPKSEAESPKIKEVKEGIAAIGEQIPKETPSFFILLIALAIAIFSGVIILILKKKIKSFDLSKKIE